VKQDPFENLKEWGTVLDLLNQLDQKGMLGECQKGMIRVLRYKDNWRLREEVLKRIGTIENPSYDLIEQVVAMVADEKVYYRTRIMALNALEKLAKAGCRLPERSAVADRPKWTAVLQGVLKKHQPPILANALIACLHSLEAPLQARTVLHESAM